MAYLDPASNPGSKTQRFSVKNCKSFVLKGNFMQEKSRNLSGKQGEESMIWDKMSCINGWMVKSNLVII